MTNRTVYEININEFDEAYSDLKTKSVVWLEEHCQSSFPESVLADKLNYDELDTVSCYYIVK